MGEAKHTPGPWEIDVSCGGEVSVFPVDSDAPYVIARVPQVDERRTRAESRSNAKLLAAAPDLLAACNALLPLLEEAIDCGMPIRQDVADARNMAVAAIAKAEPPTSKERS